ncbi:hypothetical protein HN011_009221 [Eciton burchellii]|nr:hypothetical protein HN011_009221 [Eciton burchellii]
MLSARSSSCVTALPVLELVEAPTSGPRRVHVNYIKLATFSLSDAAPARFPSRSTCSVMVLSPHPIMLGDAHTTVLPIAAAAAAAAAVVLFAITLAGLTSVF